MPYCFGRRKKSSQPSRQCTQEEISAWSNRPYGCHDLKKALELHRENDEKGRARAWSRKFAQEHAARKAKWAATPEWCYPHEHPLRCGFPGKLYHRSDYVGPICDSITRVHRGVSSSDAFGVFTEPPKKKRRRDGYDEAEDAEQARRDQEALERVPGGKLYKDYGWTCVCCGNRDERSQVQTKEALVCPCGTVVRMGGEVVSTHREKLGAAQEDDKTQHADAVREQRTDKYDHAPLSVEDRRKARRFDAKLTNIGGRVKGTGRLCDAHRLMEESRQKDIRDSAELSSRETLKQERILEATEKMFKALAPVDHVIKRRVRMEVDGLWLDAVRHNKVCTTHGCCEMRLADRTAAIIASSVFEITVDRIISGELVVDQLDREHVIDLQTRMQRSPAFSNASSMTQMSSAKAIIAIMQEPGFDPCVPCEATFSIAAPPVKASAPPLPPSLAPIRPPLRVDSSMSVGENSPPAGDVVQFRDAVTNVYLAHKTALPVSVRDGALRAIQSPSFLANCKSVVCIKSHSLYCVAFCVLNAVEREQSDACPSFANDQVASLNVPIAHKLELDLAVAEEAIQAIRMFVPSDVASEPSDREDDLFS